MSEPLTDAQLDWIASGLDWSYPTYAENIVRLVAEFRWLRSDEWPTAAATEVLAHLFGEAGSSEVARVAAILRKHRDGKA